MTFNSSRACVATFLVVATLPLGLQGQTTAPSFLSQTITRQAARMASTAAQAGRATDTPPQHDNAGWSRVRKLRAGTEIVVTLRGPGSGTRYFDSATDTDVTLRDLQTGPATIARTEILQVTAPVRVGSATGAVIGSWLGLISGAALTFATGGRGASVLLAYGGGIGGAFVGYRAQGREVDGVVYRAP